MRAFSRVLAFLSLVFAGALDARAWDQISSFAAREAAECVTWSASRLDCFWRTPAGSLAWAYRTGGKWSAPHDLGGKLAAAPSCVVRGPGGINCFATSAKGVLATIHLNGSTWSKWASLGGELKPSRASCVSLGRDRIACFARGAGGHLVSRRWSGGKSWEPWRDLGGALSADPKCILVGGASAACFARGTGGELVAFLPDAAGASGGWTTLGARIEGRPSCVRLRSGDAACAAQGRNGRLSVWRGTPLFARGAGETVSLEERVSGEPACALQSATMLCFARNARGELMRRAVAADATSFAQGAVVLAPSAFAISCTSLGETDLACALTDSSRKLLAASGAALEPVKVVAAPTPLPAPLPTPTPVADEGVLGAWYLTNLESGTVCRVHLLGDGLFGGQRMRLGPRCRGVDMAARPVQWDRDADELLFLAVDGRIVMRLREREAGRWISPRQSAAFMLTRELPEVSVGSATPPSDDVSEMFGPWRVVADGAGPLCSIRLTNARTEVGYAARFDPECDTHFAGVRYWTASGAALVFVGPGNVVLARFDSAGPGTWRSQALGGLTLER